jgi:hypothetical protein
MIDDRERSYLRGLRWRRRAALAMGLLLTLAGGFYALWGAGQFQSELGIEAGQERSVASWDPPARLALLFAPYHERLREAEPETETESILLGELDEQTTLTTQLLVLLVRFLFASMVLTPGLILVSSGLGNRRLLAIVDSMLEQQDRGRRTSPPS